ncbi:MAG: hypothetical protein V1724_06910, partial [Chloroflexota bacterium]
YVQSVMKETQMNATFSISSKRGVLKACLLLGLLFALVLGACSAAPTPADSQANTSPNGSSGNPDGGKDITYSVMPSPVPPQPGEAGGQGSTGAGTAGVVVDESLMYQWVGQIVVSELRGAEVARSCDSWRLIFTSPEVESKAVNNAGLKIILWGHVDRSDALERRPAIVVEAVYLPGDNMPEVAVPEYPCLGETREQTYSWVGVVEVSELEGRHLEMARGCDIWILLPESEDMARKLETFIGKKAIVWGMVSNDPNIYMRQIISVSSVHGPEDAVPAIYLPEYPCPGRVVPPIPPVYVQPEIDLMPGEIAIIGKVIREGDAMYLDTPSGRVVLNGANSGSWTISAGPSSGTSAVRCVPPNEKSLVVGKWLVEDGTLTIQVRYIRHWGYYVCPEPVPPTPAPWLTVEPLDGMGVLYGQVRIGPLCPVEPCPNPNPDVYSSRSLVLQPGSGVPIYVPLMPDGWFKEPVPAGAYLVTLTNCDFLGCKGVLPRDVKMAAGEATMLEIDIDTGIR